MVREFMIENLHGGRMRAGELPFAQHACNDAAWIRRDAVTHLHHCSFRQLLTEHPCEVIAAPLNKRFFRQHRRLKPDFIKSRVRSVSVAQAVLIEAHD